VSTFYVLPPRPLVGEHYAAFLAALFPGLDWPRDAHPELADALARAAGGRGDVYVVHREDLPQGEELGQALVEHFGAGPGDEVVEVWREPRPGPWAARRRRLGAASSPAG
jgi:hypothetical protein